jgi:acyl-CoA synthetase (AMP-forming)/AMP-acid ligase II
MAAAVEPSVRAEGPFISPSKSELPPEYQATTPRSIEAILEKHSSAQNKVNAGAVLDQNGKISASLTYGNNFKADFHFFSILGKLFSRSIKIAHMLKTKTTSVVGVNGHKEKIPICKPGECIALVYPNTDPLSYLAAFYGCLLAGCVPISVEVSTVKRVSFLVVGCTLVFYSRKIVALKPIF